MSRQTIIEANFTAISGVCDQGKEIVFSVLDKGAYAQGDVFTLSGESFTVSRLEEFTATEGRDTAYYLFILTA
jgi:hypothetical protein